MITPGVAQAGTGGVLSSEGSEGRADEERLLVRLGRASRAAPALRALPRAPSKTGVSFHPKEKWALMGFAAQEFSCGV